MANLCSECREKPDWLLLLLLRHKTSVFPFSTIFRSTFFMNKETLFCQFDLTAYVVRRGEKSVFQYISLHNKRFPEVFALWGVQQRFVCRAREYMNKKKSAHEWSCFTFTTKQFVTLNQVDFMLNTKCSSFSALQKRREKERPLLVVCSSYCFVTQ